MTYAQLLMLTLEYEHTKEETNERNTHTVRTYNNFYKYKCKKVGGDQLSEVHVQQQSPRYGKTWSANMVENLMCVTSLNVHMHDYNVA